MFDEMIHGDVNPRWPTPASKAVEFAVEKFSDTVVEASELLRLHYAEIAPYQDLFKLNPDIATYMKLQATGILYIVTARSAGKLVGYVSLIVKEHVHYKDVLMATDDIHFLHPDWRKGGTGLRMLKFAEQKMREMGVKVMALRTKVASNHGVLFERLGYEPMDVVYLKRLDQEP